MAYPSGRHGAAESRPKSIVFCNLCGLGVAYPVPGMEEIEDLYASGTYWENRPVERLTRRKFPVPYAMAEARWKLLEPFLRTEEGPLAILDVGAGHGFMGMVAVRSQAVSLGKYTAVEKDRSLTESLKLTWNEASPGISLQIAANLDEVEGFFRCAVLSHILEHVIDPKGLMLQVMSKLEPGGIVFIDVPNQDHLFKYDVFPHFLFFNANSLKLLLEMCGLRTGFVDTFGKGMDRSPLNYRNTSLLRTTALRFITAAGTLLPTNVMPAFFNRYFGMEEINSRGTWIRALAFARSSSRNGEANRP
jgi:hypothetical protein